MRLSFDEVADEPIEGEAASSAIYADSLHLCAVCETATTSVHIRGSQCCGIPALHHNVVAAAGFNQVIGFGCLSSQSVGLVPCDEYTLVILDSVGDSMYYGN
jgi:hypothetical protein